MLSKNLEHKRLRVKHNWSFFNLLYNTNMELCLTCVKQGSVPSVMLDVNILVRCTWCVPCVEMEWEKEEEGDVPEAQM